MRFPRGVCVEEKRLHVSIHLLLARKEVTLHTYLPSFPPARRVMIDSRHSRLSWTGGRGRTLSICCLMTFLFWGLDCGWESWLGSVDRFLQLHLFRTRSTRWRLASQDLFRGLWIVSCPITFPVAMSDRAFSDLRKERKVLMRKVSIITDTFPRRDGRKALCDL